MTCRLCRGTAILHKPSCPAYCCGLTCSCTPRVCPRCGGDRPFWSALLGIVLTVVFAVGLWYALWIARW